MKVLILSCSTGEGHNSAGNAVSEYFKASGIQCDIVNAFNFVSQPLSEFLSKGHVFVYRNMPRLFGVGYKIEEKYPPKSFYRKMAKGAPALAKYIRIGEYDAVICSHIFAAMMLTECRHNFGCGAPAYLIATDYTCSPGANMLDMDAYFIPHEKLAAEFADKGIPSERIVPSGIPVSQKFFSAKPKAQSREELGLPADSSIILLSSGSMGCGPMGELTQKLLDKADYGTKICVICGNNKKLYDELLPLCRDSRLVLEGFTLKMYDYMNSADVYITKAGGLSSTEAVALGVPLVFVAAVPGCESYNISFLTSNNCAVTADSADKITELALDIVKNRTAYSEKFSKGQKSIAGNGAKNIYDYVINDSYGRKNAEKTEEK